MKKRGLIYIALLGVSIFLIGCTSKINTENNDSKIQELQNQIKSYEKSVSQLQEKISTYELDIRILKEEKDDYKKFIDSSRKYLSKNELLELAKGEWIYRISVNDKAIESSGVLEIDKKDFKITYSEKRSTFSGLPEEIDEKGSISGNFYDHLEILNIKPDNVVISDGTVVQGMHYEFKDVPKGTIIKLEISDELKERLGLQTNIISIHVK